jgi:hypothetical protein
MYGPCSGQRQTTTALSCPPCRSGTKPPALLRRSSLRRLFLVQREPAKEQFALAHLILDLSILDMLDRSELDAPDSQPDAAPPVALASALSTALSCPPCRSGTKPPALLRRSSNSRLPISSSISAFSTCWTVPNSTRRTRSRTSRLRGVPSSASLRPHRRSPWLLHSPLL